MAFWSFSASRRPWKAFCEFSRPKICALARRAASGLV